MTALQKLLVPRQSEQVRIHGQMGVGGVVIPLAEAFALSTPAQLLAAYGYDDGGPFGAEPSSVDVVRFPLRALMTLENVPTAQDVPWPTYPSGFLRSEALVRVWNLQRTRWPRGAELWRIGADGAQECVTVYDGAARGWRGASAYTPPRQFVGPWVRWGGSEYAADLLDDEGTRLELIAVGPTPPAGFEPTRPMISVRTVERAECEQVQALVLTATWGGLSCRIVHSDGTNARIVVEPVRPEQAATLPADAEVEPGVFELTVATSELTEGGGRADVLPIRGRSR